MSVHIEDCSWREKGTRQSFHSINVSNYFPQLTKAGGKTFLTATCPKSEIRFPQGIVTYLSKKNMLHFLPGLI